jgi:hypothetical protein
MIVLGIQGEVVVSDNGSTDGYDQAAIKSGARLVHQDQLGYGAAVMGGVQAAEGDYIVMLDADSSYGLNALGPMIDALRNGADLVMGNRFRGHLARGSMPWTHRYIGNPVLSSLLRLLFGTSVGDAHCGLRAFTRDAYRRMALKTTGMEFASEMVARAARIQLRIVEVPVDYHPRTGASKLRSFRDGWRHLRFLLMFSPTWLYLLPAAVLSVLGLGLLVALALGPIEAFGRVWDMHLAAVASMLCVLGTQIAWLGISARTVAVIHGLDPEDRFLELFFRIFTLERGLVLGLLLCVTGAAIGAIVLARWANAGFLALDAIRPVLLSVTLAIIGVQGMFNAFFLSLLSVQTRTVARRL